MCAPMGKNNRAFEAKLKVEKKTYLCGDFDVFMSVDQVLYMWM
jgi:hypothetical protein